MAIVYIDGRSYRASDRDNMLAVCLSLGFDLPYFCWHPGMGSVGSCRQCAVKQFRDDGDDAGRIVMACMTPAADGTRIAIADPQASAFRASVIEWLMTNHPHDCPVCEEGGECHLQDMTVMTGHAYRRYRFNKRTFRNQDLGPFLNHEMNRCIACYRCVRFYRDYAGGHDLHAMAAHNHVYFGRHEDGVLQSEFSGNLAEICPTGVFTDKTLGQFYNRKWDLRGAPSVCVHCGLGCNTTPNERVGRLRRVLNRYNGAVNGYFLCDRGRFGGAFVNHPERLRRPLLRLGDGASETETVSGEAALSRLADRVSAGEAIGIGSPRASLEANFALRELVGAEHFHLGIAGDEQRLFGLICKVLRDGPSPIASLHDAEQADAVLVLGEDVANTAPRLALSLRQAVRQKSLAVAGSLGVPLWLDSAVRDAAHGQKSPLFVVTPDATRLDDIAAETLRAAPDDIARLGFAIANALDSAAPAVRLPRRTAALARTIADRLRAAERPVVVAGTGCGSAAIIEAAANVARALCRAGRAAKLCPTVPECNSMGLALMGGGTLADAFAALESGEAKTLIVLENDLYRRADEAAVSRALDSAREVIVLDHTMMTETATRAGLAVPAATFAEADGTLISSEGRAQRFFRLYVPEEGDIRPSWRWLADALHRLGGPHWQRFDAVTAACAAALPAISGIVAAAPAADFRIAGSRIRREPHRYSGRTALVADKTMREPPPPADPDTAFSFSMEGAYDGTPAALIPFVWAPGWNSVQAVNKFQAEIGGALRGGDPGVRLISPQPQATPDYFHDVPKAFSARRAAWLIVPCFEIFGSEELSRLAPAVAERVPAPYLTLNPDDAARLGAAEGTAIDVGLGETTQRLAARLRPSLPKGVAGVPVGLAAPFDTPLPAWATLALADGGR